MGTQTQPPQEWQDLVPGRSTPDVDPLQAAKVAESMLPSMTFLMHEAHRAGLDEIKDMLSETLVNITLWIEEKNDGHCSPRRSSAS